MHNFLCFYLIPINNGWGRLVVVVMVVAECAQCTTDSREWMPVHKTLGTTYCYVLVATWQWLIIECVSTFAADIVAWTEYLRFQSQHQFDQQTRLAIAEEGDAFQCFWNQEVKTCTLTSPLLYYIYRLYPFLHLYSRGKTLIMI